MGHKGLVVAALFVGLFACVSHDRGEPRRLRSRAEGAPGEDPFVAYLDMMKEDGLLGESAASDMLLPREQLWKQVDRIPADYEGYAGATVEGKLLFDSNESSMLKRLEAASPIG